MKRFLNVVLLTGLSLVLVGCSQMSPESSDEKETVKIGVIAPLSGPHATHGEDAVTAYQSVLSKNNDNEQFDFQLVIEDGKCEGRDAVTAMQKLINVDKVQIVIGGNCSSETLAAGTVAESQGVVMLSPTSSSPEISDIGDFVFRYWNDLDASKVLVDYLHTIEANTIALVYENVDYAIAYANAVKSQFNGKVILEEKFDANQKDMSIIASRLAATESEIDQIIFLPQSDTSSIAFVDALNTIGIWKNFSSKIIGSEVLMSDTFIDELGKLTNGIKIVQFPPFEELDNKAVVFMNEYREDHEVKGNETFVVLDAEALQLAIDAITMAGNDAISIREFIAGYDAENPRDGLFGPYYFNRVGDGQGLHFIVQEIYNGKLRQVSY